MKTRLLALVMSNCLMLLLVVSGCVPFPLATPTSISGKPVDRSLLTDQPCAVPCWYGIVPGKTCKDDLQILLEENEYIDHSKPLEWFKFSEDGNVFEQVGWVSAASPQHGCNLMLRDEVVLELTCRLNYDLTLEQVIDRFGQPAGVYVSIGGGEVVWHNYSFFYPSKGLTFVGTLRVDWSRNTGDASLYPDLRLHSVSYFEPTTLHQYVSHVLRLDEKTADEFIGAIQPWPGIGGTVRVVQ